MNEPLLPMGVKKKNTQTSLNYLTFMLLIYLGILICLPLLLIFYIGERILDALKLSYSIIVDGDIESNKLLGLIIGLFIGFLIYILV